MYNTNNTTTYTLKIYKTKNQLIPTTTHKSSPHYNHSYLPLLQLAIEYYNNYYYIIEDDSTSEIIHTNII